MRTTVLIAAALLATPAAAKWSVDVQQSPALAGAHVVAIAPLECPAEVNCADTEKELAALVREKTPWTLVDSAKLKQAAFDQGLTTPVPIEDFRRVAASLGADAVLVADVGVNATPRGATGVLVGGVFVAQNQTKKNGTCSLLVTTIDGKPLLQGSGTGESRNAWRTEQGMAVKMLRLILEKAFPGR